MVQNVSKINNRLFKLTILLLGLQMTALLSQTTVPPQYLGDSSSQANTKTLCRIIGSIGSVMDLHLPECKAGMGIFSFEVTKEGTVDSVMFEGNLHSVIISKIKKNILSTSGKWKPQLVDGKPTDSMPILLIYISSIMSCPEMPSYQLNEYQLGFMLKKALLPKGEPKLTVLNNAYLLPVFELSSVR